MDPTAKQQIVERLKQANNVLVTVSNNPSVDQLAACIGFTLLLNKMNKHGTAVFSGQIPSTLEFLQPDKTIEQNTDSLRDFIISLDKSKADKLRYKVEDQVVRIFITPYRTSLSEADLVFSQGDFNVEVVIGLGVKERDQLDAAITAHGRILHDATVISVNSGEGQPANLGSLNWQDPQSSSLCEMLVSMSEAFGSGLIDNQMATAFLTGIVAETERFSNKKTSPKVMTMSAQLMAAGANQQLIANKLADPVAAAPPLSGGAATSPGETLGGQQAKPAADGGLNIAHNEKAEVPNPDAIHIDEHGNMNKHDLQKQQEEAAQKEDNGLIDPLINHDENAPGRQSLDPAGQPSRGGTLSANTTPEEYGGTSDPMSQPTKNGPMLKRDSEKRPPAPDMPIADLIEPQIQQSPDPPPPKAEMAEPKKEPAAAPPPPENTPPPLAVPDPPKVEPKAEAPAPPPPAPDHHAAGTMLVPPELSEIAKEVEAADEKGAFDPLANPEKNETDSARSKVNSAINSVPFDPAGHPTLSHGSAGLDHGTAHQITPPPDHGLAVSAEAPAPADKPPADSPAPPPVPPPLPIDNLPGLNLPPPQPPK